MLQICSYDVVFLFFSLCLMYLLDACYTLGLCVTQALHQVTIVTSSVSVHVSCFKSKYMHGVWCLYRENQAIYYWTVRLWLGLDLGLGLGLGLGLDLGLGLGLVE